LKPDKLNKYQIATRKIVEACGLMNDTCDLGWPKWKALNFFISVGSHKDILPL